MGPDHERNPRGSLDDVAIEVVGVVVAVTDDRPRVLTVGGAAPRLPTGALHLSGDVTLERALRRMVLEQTGLELGYVEQLYTLGDRDRGTDLAVRLISVAYLALVREREPQGDSQWRDLYEFLPWEDFRDGRPAPLDRSVIPALRDWVERSDGDAADVRRERAGIVFGRDGSPWDIERSLERYELLYEMGWVPEAGARQDPPQRGAAMALDHRRIVAQALGRVRGKLRYRPVVFELLSDEFTLTGLQRVVEALSGTRLHSQNFRRLIDRGGLVEGTGRHDTGTGGRPAELHRFRREVVRERPAPGVGLPGMPTSG
jgi:hypothetical protein